MEKIITHINSHLYFIKLLFSGQYLPSTSTDLKELVYDVEDIEIATFAADRANLNTDRKKVSKDLKAAVETKKLEFAD